MTELYYLDIPSLNTGKTCRRTTQYLNMLYLLQYVMCDTYSWKFEKFTYRSSMVSSNEIGYKNIMQVLHSDFPCNLELDVCRCMELE